jgi:hypothetical protein
MLVCVLTINAYVGRLLLVVANAPQRHESLDGRVAEWHATGSGMVARSISARWR